jgi:hypothetical protein
LVLVSLAAVGEALLPQRQRTCQLNVLSNTSSVNLEEDNGTDSVFFKLGTHPHTDSELRARGQCQLNIGTETFQKLDRCYASSRRRERGAPGSARIKTNIPVARTPRCRSPMSATADAILPL